MARFGRDIIAKMHVLTRELEVTLGPDTGDLTLRIGMHSGKCFTAYTAYLFVARWQLD